MGDSVPKQGFDLFSDRLCPKAVAEIKAWESHPELGKLFGKFCNLGKTQAQQFLDHYAEAMVARHFIKLGCDIRVEVSTPNRKQADFKVSLGESVIYAHLKRLNTDAKTQAHINSGESPPFGYLKDRVRLKRLLNDAYEQFMPNALNVIMATSPWNGDVDDFKEALFGQGSARLGFWNEGHSESKCAVWFRFDWFLDTIRFKLFFRDMFNASQKQLLEQIFPENIDLRVS